MKFNLQKTRYIKLNVRPVSVTLHHNYVFEGPCRFRKGEELKKEFDLKVNAELHEYFVENVEAAMPSEDVNILEPIHIQVDESFLISDADLEEIAKDYSEVDLYIFNAGVSEIYLEFAMKYKKPMIIMGGCLNTMCSAAFLARGLEVHPCETIADAAEITKILRVRKALAGTKVLSFTRMNSDRAPAMMDGFLSLNEVTSKFGVRFINFNIHEFFDQTHNVPADTNPTTPGKIESNITGEDEIEIKKMTEKFIRDAIGCHMTYEDIYPSMKAHYLINKLLERTECNAFTAPCFDVCATRRFNEERFTFCLNHSLNNENGITSACESDMNSVLSMVVLSNFAKAAPYMGNTICNPIRTGLLQYFIKSGLLNPESVGSVIKELEDKENLVITFHAVPNRKFKGYDTKDAAYSIRSFAHSGWGATIRYDFTEDEGQEVTMCRFGPDCKTLFVAKGIIVGGIGYDDVNCSEGVIFQVKNTKDFFQKMSLVGNHVPLVYGDYFDQVVKLGEILGLKVLTA
jgi:L-fucose isomerase-like protein